MVFNNWILLAYDCRSQLSIIQDYRARNKINNSFEESIEEKENLCLVFENEMNEIWDCVTFWWKIKYRSSSERMKIKRIAWIPINNAFIWNTFFQNFHFVLSRRIFINRFKKFCLQNSDLFLSFCSKNFYVQGKNRKRPLAMTNNYTRSTTFLSIQTRTRARAHFSIPSNRSFWWRAAPRRSVPVLSSRSSFFPPRLYTLRPHFFELPLFATSFLLSPLLHRVPADYRGSTWLLMTTRDHRREMETRIHFRIHPPRIHPSSVERD